MSLTWNFILTFGTLAAAIAALWLPAPEFRGDRSWLWAPVLGLACLAGVVSGVLTWQAPCWIALYAVLALWARQASNRWLRVLLMLLTWFVPPFLVAPHLLPGFTTAILADRVQFSAGAPASSIHANFDFAAVGVVLSGVFCQRMRTLREWLQMLGNVWPVTVSTLIVVLGLGMLMGYVRPDLKWTPYSLYFLAANLLFTCVTEEAFFRGFTFVGLSRLMSRWRFGTLAAAIVSALLFGIAHAKGGALLIVLATVAGLHYAAAHAVSRRVEGAILTHFALNAVHFVAFTYPNLSG